MWVKSILVCAVLHVAVNEVSAISREQGIARVLEMLSASERGFFHPTMDGPVPGIAISIECTEAGNDSMTFNWVWAHPDNYAILRVDAPFTQAELDSNQARGNLGIELSTYNPDSSRKSMDDFTLHAATKMDSAGFWLGNPLLTGVTILPNNSGIVNIRIPEPTDLNQWGITTPAVRLRLYKSSDSEDLYHPSQPDSHLWMNIPRYFEPIGLIDQTDLDKKFYTILAEDKVLARINGSPQPPNAFPLISTVPLQTGTVNQPGSFAPLYLPTYANDVETPQLRYEWAGGGTIDAIINNDTLRVISAPTAGLDSTNVWVFDQDGAQVPMTINYQINPDPNNFHLLVKDFDRNIVDSAKVRIITPTDSTDYETTDGWVHLNLPYEPTDSVTVRTWRNTPGTEWIGVESGADSMSSFVYTEKYPSSGQHTIQIQTWDVCDSMNVSPGDYKQWVNNVRGRLVRINGIWTQVLGGINPDSMSLDTMLFGNINPVTGDTTYQENRDLMQAEAQRFKDTQLFPDSPFPTFYQPPVGTSEPFIGGYGPSRQHLHLYYRKVDSNCWITLYRDIPNNASTTRGIVQIANSMPESGIRQETGTNLACTNGAPANVPAMDGKSIYLESGASSDYTLLDQAMHRVWIQTLIIKDINEVYGLPWNYIP